ncbi:hypothetical protein D8771_17650 [Streptomyces albus]|uniref:Uncharacterized protein n=1 Tax=Streptomyces albus TaxID=1888 RepID=A0A8H1QPJ2_9ACTN|nr:hypothetical protein D8771_17650 [Streptomyces albus]
MCVDVPLPGTRRGSGFLVGGQSSEAQNFASSGLLIVTTVAVRPRSILQGLLRPLVTFSWKRGFSPGPYSLRRLRSFSCTSPWRQSARLGGAGTPAAPPPGPPVPEPDPPVELPLPAPQPVPPADDWSAASESSEPPEPPEPEAEPEPEPSEPPSSSSRPPGRSLIAGPESAGPGVIVPAGPLPLSPLLPSLRELSPPSEVTAQKTTRTSSTSTTRTTALRRQ